MQKSFVEMVNGQAVDETNKIATEDVQGIMNTQINSGKTDQKGVDGKRPEDTAADKKGRQKSYREGVSGRERKINQAFLNQGCFRKGNKRAVAAEKILKTVGVENKAGKSGQDEKDEPPSGVFPVDENET